jgi:hypothetical protein
MRRRRDQVPYSDWDPEWDSESNSDWDTEGDRDPFWEPDGRRHAKRRREDPAPARTGVVAVVAALAITLGVTAGMLASGQGGSLSLSAGDPSESADPPGSGAGGKSHSADRPGSVPSRSRKTPKSPSQADFIDIRQVRPAALAPRPGRNASKGTFVSRCGTNAGDHNNTDNYIVAPGTSNGAHHLHDYVGNVSADAFSTDESLAAAGSTCRLGDKSTYYWPVLRVPGNAVDDGTQDGNVGQVLRPTSATMQFRGNARGEVTAMPRFLRVITGNAKAATAEAANAKSAWSCTGFTNRVTTKYPLCPRGSQVVRTLDFPSCWDGENTDSADHRTHVAFPESGSGACPAGTKAIPQLRMRLTYRVPPGRSFALDSFPEQLHNPITDHGDFENLMPARLMSFAVNCINRDRNC